VGGGGHYHTNAHRLSARWEVLTLAEACKRSKALMKDITADRSVIRRRIFS
jgi:hypothetical protein